MSEGRKLRFGPASDVESSAVSTRKKTSNGAVIVKRPGGVVVDPAAVERACAQAAARLSTYASGTREFLLDVSKYVAERGYITQRQLEAINKIRQRVLLGDFNPAATTMRKFIFVPPMSNPEDHTNAAYALVQSESAPRGIEITRYSNDAWSSARRSCGSWEELYAWTARSFDGVVVVETERRALSRGCYETAACALEADKPVVVVTWDLKLARARTLARIESQGRDSWQKHYGTYGTVA